jgi:hypothetical protein
LNYKFISLALPIAIAMVSSVATADTIGGPGSSCTTCDGAAYTLTYSGAPISLTATTQTFQIMLDVNDSSYTGGGSFLNAVAVQVAPSSDVIAGSLLSAPGDFSFSGIEGLNANGCNGSNGGFLCAEAVTNSVPVTGGPYDFVFDVTVKTGTLLTGLDAASVKAQYVDSNGKKAGALLSEPITLQTTATPEPSSYLTLGSGLLAMGLFLRRRLAKQVR